MLVDSASHSLTFLGRGACDVCPGSPELKVTGLSQTVSNSPITRRFSESFAGTYRGNSLGNEPLQHQSHAFKHGECQTSSHQQKTWRAAHVDLVRRTGLKKEETAQVSDRHLLLLNLRGNAERGEYFLDNRKRVLYHESQERFYLFHPAVTGRGGKWERLRRRILRSPSIPPTSTNSSLRHPRRKLHHSLPTLALKIRTS